MPQLLGLGESTPVPNEQKFGWAPKLVWMYWREKESSYPGGNRAAYRLSRNSASLYALGFMFVIAKRCSPTSIQVSLWHHTVTYYRFLSGWQYEVKECWKLLFDTIVILCLLYGKCLPFPLLQISPLWRLHMWGRLVNNCGLFTQTFSMGSVTHDLLCPWSCVRSEKLIGPQIVKKFLAF